VTDRVRVCFVGATAYALFHPDVQDSFGGAEVQLYLLSTGLARDDRFEVHFITGDYGQPSSEVVGGVVLHRGIPVRADAGLMRALRWGPRLVRIIRGIGADVLVQRTAGAHTGLFRLATQALGQKMAYMVAHQIDCNGEFERATGFLPGALYRYGLRRADLVVAQSEEQRTLLRRHHGRVSVLMPSMHVIPPEEEVVEAARDCVLWVGRCEPWKRPELVFQLSRRFPQERFVMIAPPALGQTALHHVIRREAARLPNLEYLDFVPFRDIDAYFRRAKLLLQTSVHEGFPNTFIQAAKNGTPIASLQVNPDDVLGRFDCGACADGDIERLVEIVGRLLADRTLRDRQAKSGWRYARTHHDAEPIIERYKAILRDLVAR